MDDKRVLSGIIFINRNGLRWHDAPEAYGPHKILYSRWKRWSEKGVFARMLLELAHQGGRTDTLIIDATHLKVHRTASSLGLKKGGRCDYIGSRALLKGLPKATTCWQTEAMMLIGIEKPLRKGGLRHVSPRARTARCPSHMTKLDTKSATKSRTALLD